MCRNIKTLYNFDPNATDDEIYSASLQYVRKISGFNKPSKQMRMLLTEQLRKFPNPRKNCLTHWPRMRFHVIGKLKRNVLELGMKKGLV